MAERIKKAGAVYETRPVALGELIHAYVREAIEMAVHEELAAALGRPATSAIAPGSAIAMGPSRGR